MSLSDVDFSNHRVVDIPGGYSREVSDRLVKIYEGCHFQLNIDYVVEWKDRNCKTHTGLNVRARVLEYIKCHSRAFVSALIGYWLQICSLPRCRCQLLLI